MKQFLQHILISSVLLITFGTNASVITNSDVNLITVTTPEAWTAENKESLLDGITGKRQGTRFIGFRNTGDELSTTNEFLINIKLNQLFTITDFSFFNDWGYHLKQQVMDMSVTFSNEGSLISTDSYTGLAMDTFEEITLFNGKDIKGVSNIEVSITKIDNINFEIRELLFSATPDSNITNVSSPASSVLMLIMIGLLFRTRK